MRPYFGSMVVLSMICWMSSMMRKPSDHEAISAHTSSAVKRVVSCFSMLSGVMAPRIGSRGVSGGWRACSLKVRKK